MSDITCLVPCTINVKYGDRFLQGLQLDSLFKSPALVYETSGGTTVQ